MKKKIAPAVLVVDFIDSGMADYNVGYLVDAFGDDRRNFWTSFIAFGTKRRFGDFHLFRSFTQLDGKGDMFFRHFPTSSRFLNNYQLFCKQRLSLSSLLTPRSRIDTEYCDRIAKGEIKPCNEIGAMKLHQAAKAETPVHLAYQKAYRRMNAKARTKRITQTEFLEWSDEARVKRDSCLNGALAFDVFRHGWKQIKRNRLISGRGECNLFLPECYKKARFCAIINIR